MYWAVLYHVNNNVASLTVFVVDFDGMAPYTDVSPQIGPLVVQTTESRLAAPKPHLGYQTVPASHFGNDPLNVRREVFDQKAWAAIVINANATVLLQRAVETGNTSYDPLGACQIYWVEARDQDTIHAHVAPEIQSLATSITSNFGAQWTRQVLENASIPITNLEAAPQALSPAIGFSIFNLRPFDPPVTLPAVSIGLIYLIIISFFSFAFYMPTHMKFLIPAGHPPLQFNQFIIYRWFATMTAYLFMSLSYSLISLAFQIPFNRPTAPGTEVAHNPDSYGAATFVVYWMINWIGMAALGLACENVAMIIGQPWTAMWLIFWVISNVSTSFYALDLTPKFYYWGYAWPLHQSKLSLSLPRAFSFHLWKVTDSCYSCRSFSLDLIRPAFAHRPEFRGPFRLGSGQQPLLPVLLLLYAVEDAAAEDERDGSQDRGAGGEIRGKELNDNYRKARYGVLPGGEEMGIITLALDSVDSATKTTFPKRSSYANNLVFFAIHSIP